jgi:DMSO/TMAO reductase YedYZ molybdopterin-dependent catalytic subunit
VTGLVERPLSLTLGQALALPPASKVVTLHCVEGWSVKVLWEGIRLGALLDSAGVDSTANTVIFRAVDGYSTSLPLATVRDRDLVLAHRMNGVVLPRERGYPLQLVAEDKWGYKWIKWLTEVEVSADTSFRGYWEKFGYSHDGEQTGPKLERRYEPPPEP